MFRKTLTQMQWQAGALCRWSFETSINTLRSIEKKRAKEEDYKGKGGNGGDLCSFLFTKAIMTVMTTYLKLFILKTVYRDTHHQFGRCLRSENESWLGPFLF